MMVFAWDHSSGRFLDPNKALEAFENGVIGGMYSWSFKVRNLRRKTKNESSERNAEVATNGTNLLNAFDNRLRPR
jgi:hypothetical protein